MYVYIGHGKLLLGDGGYYEGTFVRGEIEGHGYRCVCVCVCVYILLYVAKIHTNTHTHTSYSI